MNWQRQSGSPPQSSRRASEAVSARGLRVVAIGGGTGLSTLLRGLKQYVVRPGEERQLAGPSISELTGIVTVSDDGGSSGRLRKELKLLPPGDVRNCIVALSEDEALLSRLFQYRFRGETTLDGHSFGNLFLAALAGVTGDFAEAVRLSSEILATRGHIYPATTSDLQLEAIMDDGSRVRGETSITNSKKRIARLQLTPADAEPLPETLEAIRTADLITVGPGSLFTSLIPNILVKGMAEAIATSPATKAYICNLMTQANESLGLTASDHIRAIYAHAGRPIFQFALVNRRQASAALRAKYALEASTQIVVDEEQIAALGVQPLFGDYLQEDEGVARHAIGRLARDLLGLFPDRYSVTAALSRPEAEGQ